MGARACKPQRAACKPLPPPLLPCPRCIPVAHLLVLGHQLVEAQAGAARKHAQVVGQVRALGAHKVTQAVVGLGPLLLRLRGRGRGWGTHAREPVSSVPGRRSLVAVRQRGAAGCVCAHLLAQAKELGARGPCAALGRVLAVHLNVVAHGVRRVEPHNGVEAHALLRDEVLRTCMRAGATRPHGCRAPSRGQQVVCAHPASRARSPAA